MFFLIFIYDHAEYFPPKQNPPYLKRDYAHRGLHDSSRLIPENSMPAFREAVKQNLAIELDIHLTRDGKVVVSMTSL